jgi:hypothetical protein
LALPCGRRQSLESENTRPLKVRFLFSYVITHVRTRVSRKADHMQQTLWGDKERPQFTRRHTSRTTLPTVVHTTSDGPIYGHNLQTVGMLGEKRCTACSIQGYCQGCISNPPANAQPFYCTRHTPLTESQVSA